MGENNREDTWAEDSLADRFLGAYDTAKGFVRTAVMHRQLIEHLPAAPARILDVGGGAGTQSFPLAAAGYDVTLLDSSPAMLARARENLASLPEDASARVTLVESDGRDAAASVGGRPFDAVLCHGVLGYLDDPEPLVAQLCRCANPGGIVSIMTGNARTQAVRPALEQRWDDALAAFDEPAGIGVLGVRGRADTVEELGAMLRTYGVQPVDWYGVWLFADWLEFGGTRVDVSDRGALRAMAEVEYEAARRDPYRAMSRVFHLIGRKS
ncbi:SAM-dependent methyltransferase [Microbacterium mangrovi]|uniref:SAM-dependent methyltransferase n=1 Tax=Microbacterium mangrovi TaxID=1348253 RepID=A0A0B2A878_9MICO|nr:methyltransferase [Microbacterium mangrovi]KHK97968.1 SAM-dependent methyltransferase [Microbacterium mangrovi]